MSSLNNRKNQGITEYSALVCVLIFKVWCGFANQALLFAAGAMISGLIDFGVCAYICLNFRRINKDRQKNTATSNFFVALWMFCIIYILLMLLGREVLPQTTFLGMIPMPKQISNTLFLLIYVSGLALSVKNLSEEERKFVSNFVIVIFFAVALANLITVIMNPELTKNEAHNEGTSLFTLGYSGSYPMVIMTPILLYKLGETKHKFLFGATVACHIASIFLGGYFIAVLSMIVILLVYWVLGIKNDVIVLVLCLALMLSCAVLIFSGALEEMMRYLADNVGVKTLSDRFDDIARYLGGETDVTAGDTTIRLKIYEETFAHFLNHPIFGNFVVANYACQKDHATILDMLSMGGIFLGGLFAAFMTIGYKFAATFVKNQKAKRALLAAFIGYLFMAILNPVFIYKPIGILFSVAPIVLGGKAENADENS